MDNNTTQQQNQQPEQQQQVQMPQQELHTSGYQNSTYRHDQQFQEEQQQAAQQDQARQEFENLAQQMGINPEELTAQQQGQPPVEQPPEVPPEQKQEDDFLRKFEGERGQKILNDFKELTGIDVKEAYGMVQKTSQMLVELEGWRREVNNQREAERLHKEFGDQYDVIMPQVLERFGQLQKTNPKLARALDNAEGARLLAAQIRQEGSAPVPGGRQTFVPQNSRPLYRGARQSPVIKVSEMLTWDDATKQARYNDVVRAKQAGTLINDL